MSLSSSENTQKPWSLWIAQVLSILRLEARKRLLGRRSLLIYLLAGAPVLLFFLGTFVEAPPEAVQQLGGRGVLFAGIFRTLFLRLFIFFGCVGIFMNLFRGDVLEKTLHYYFLAPVRREVLAVGKYVSGVMTAFVLFGLSTGLSFVLFYIPQGSLEFKQFFFSGPGIGHLIAYLGVVLLACVGYGSVFLLMGLLFRNPILPAVFILGWESINFLLPSTLKKISVVYYLDSLCPVPIPPGPITLLADPAPFWVAVPGLLTLTAVVLLLSGLRLRTMEVSYGGE